MISVQTLTIVNSDTYFHDKQNNPWARSYLFLVDLFYKITILLRDVLRPASVIVPGGGGSEADGGQASAKQARWQTTHVKCRFCSLFEDTKLEYDQFLKEEIFVFRIWDRLIFNNSLLTN